MSSLPDEIKKCGFNIRWDLLLKAWGPPTRSAEFQCVPVESSAELIQYVARTLYGITPESIEDFLVRNGVIIKESVVDDPVKLVIAITWMLRGLPEGADRRRLQQYLLEPGRFFEQAIAKGGLDSSEARQLYSSLAVPVLTPAVGVVDLATNYVAQCIPQFSSAELVDALTELIMNRVGPNYDPAKRYLRPGPIQTCASPDATPQEAAKFLVEHFWISGSGTPTKPKAPGSPVKSIPSDIKALVSAIMERCAPIRGFKVTPTGVEYVSYYLWNDVQKGLVTLPEDISTIDPDVFDCESIPPPGGNIRFGTAYYSMLRYRIEDFLKAVSHGAGAVVEGQPVEVKTGAEVAKEEVRGPPSLGEILSEAEDYYRTLYCTEGQCEPFGINEENFEEFLANTIYVLHSVGLLPSQYREFSKISERLVKLPPDIKRDMVSKLAEVLVQYKAGKVSEQAVLETVESVLAALKPPPVKPEVPKPTPPPKVVVEVPPPKEERPVIRPHVGIVITNREELIKRLFPPVTLAPAFVYNGKLILFYRGTRYYIEMPDIVNAIQEANKEVPTTVTLPVIGALYDEIGVRRIGNEYRFVSVPHNGYYIYLVVGNFNSVIPMRLLFKDPTEGVCIIGAYGDMYAAPCGADTDPKALYVIRSGKLVKEMGKI